ncbi:hypothetical protein AAHC03_04525 [Spirometra sp. Aus1]
MFLHQKSSPYIGLRQLYNAVHRIRLEFDPSCLTLQEEFCHFKPCGHESHFSQRLTPWTSHSVIPSPTSRSRTALDPSICLSRTEDSTKSPPQAPNVEEENVKVSKHTLDSDEEPDDDVERMNDAELLGQEPDTLEYDGDIRITPFNMREELEDGYFDKCGTFIFNKVNDVGDNWLEGVDWAEIKRKEGVQESKKTKSVEAEEKEDDDEKEAKMPPTTAAEKLKLYSEIATFMRPRETVLRTLKRLGPNKPQQRSWARKKDGTVSEKASEPVSVEARQFARLTELADDLLGSGDFDIYQKTKEVIDDYVATAREVGEENELDAFGAAIDDAQGLEPPADSEEPSSVQTKWLMKKGSADADSEVEGPFTTEDLKNWLQTGLFAKPDKVFVCRQGSNEAFRALTTVDFDKT